MPAVLPVVGGVKLIVALPLIVAVAKLFRFFIIDTCPDLEEVADAAV